MKVCFFKIVSTGDENIDFEIQKELVNPNQNVNLTIRESERNLVGCQSIDGKFELGFSFLSDDKSNKVREVFDKFNLLLEFKDVTSEVLSSNFHKIE